MKFTDLDENESLGSSTIIPEADGIPKVMTFSPEWCTMDTEYGMLDSVTPEAT